MALALHDPKSVAMLPELNGTPNAELVIKIGHGYVYLSYDRKGCLRVIREAKGGQIPVGKPKTGESVFRVTNFENGEATFKSSGSHSGLYSINGKVFWSAIWDDVAPSLFKECSFQDWVIECAQQLAETK